MSLSSGRPGRQGIQALWAGLRGVLGTYQPSESAGLVQIPTPINLHDLLSLSFLTCDMGIVRLNS